MPSFSLYLHVPFCVAKCGYCSFYSRPFDELSAEAWLGALSREAWRMRTIWGGRLPLRTVYIGGGTPSVLSLPLWKRLLRILEDAFVLSDVGEATVEANPCSLTEEHLKLWRDSFVTRVSIGAQSLQDDELLWLGRRHDAHTAARVLEAVLRYGFDVSADLIFGHPLQTLRAWHDSLRRVWALGVGHVSTYQLTLEPGTPLGDAEPHLPEGYPFYRFAQWYLERKGFGQYEVASFAKPNKECRHNMAYWRQESVLALGPAAWGYVDGFRYRNAPTLEEYAILAETQLPVIEAERLTGRKRGVEAAILALRTKQGIDGVSFVDRFGLKLLEEVVGTLQKMPARLVSLEEKRFSLTPAGMRIGNAIWTELLELSD